MGEDPDRIRLEIEHTREEMGETVDALGYKADVKSRAKDNLRDKKEAVVGVKDRIVGATPDGDDVKAHAKETGQEALDHGTQVAQDAVETAKDSAQTHGEELRDSAKEHVQETAAR
jgi:hypothetical protein